MKQILSLFVAFMVFFLIACGGESKTNKDADFSNPEKIQADSVVINEILKPQSWYVVNDKAIVLSPESEYIFYVYDIPSWNFLYAFGQNGQGPQDFLYPYIFDSGKYKDRLIVRTYSANGVRDRVIRFEDKMAEIETDTAMGRKYLNFRYRLNDSVLIKSAAPAWQSGDFNSEYKSYYYTMDSEGKNIDSILTMVVSNAKFEVSDRGFSQKSGGVFNLDKSKLIGNKFYIIYSDVRRIDIYNVSPEGKFSLEKTIGDTSTWEEVNKMNIPDIQTGEEVNTVTWGEKYIYIFVCSFENQGTWRKVINSYVEVLDYDGNKVKKYDLGRNFTRFMADEKNNKFYVYNSEYDFEKVFIYDFKI